MKLKFGYSLDKDITRPHDTYSHSYLSIFTRDDIYETYRRCLNFSWQTDNHNEGWYGMKVTLETGMAHPEFTAAVKFLAKMEKADMYRATPEAFVTWLESFKVSQLVYDDRLSRYITLEAYLATENLCCFKFYVNDQYWDNIIAKDEADAFLVVADFCKNHVYGSTVLNNRQTWEFIEHFEGVRTPLTVDSWVKSPFS